MRLNSRLARLEEVVAIRVAASAVATQAADESLARLQASWEVMQSTMSEEEGKSRREAHRALRRFVVRAIWRLWQECQQVPAENLGFAA